ncbi:MAG: hypothetical protein KGY54_01810 [Oleiphilaceae bacterium]|nr:hypothetical protein [Oleiphilaceae bacterium]
MEQSSQKVENILPGETASIENTDAEPLFISVTCDRGCCLEMELMPGQAVTFSSGDLDAQVMLHSGDPSNLLVIKPESPS